MAFPSVANVDGVNNGPNYSVAPETVQLPVGNIQKAGVFQLALTPVAVAANTTAEQTFASTGIGLQVTDFVMVNKPSAQAGLGIAGIRVSTADTLAITYVNDTGAPITPTAAESYTVYVVRVQPNWVAPASGNQLDW